MKPQIIKSGEGNNSKAAGFPWLRVSFFILVCGFVIIGSGPLPEKIWRKYQSSQKPLVVAPAPVPVPADKPKAAPPVKKLPVAPPAKKVIPPVAKTPPTPTTHIASSGGDIRKTSKGFRLHTKVTVEKGDLASKERKRSDSYTAHYELKIKLPKPSATLESLEEVSPKLSKILPGITEMMPNSQVSRFFYQSYDNKTRRLKLKATQLGQLMTQHNFYDCETILNLKHPETGNRVLLLQSEMDVVSDGSDGDRLPIMPDKIVKSSYYQPMTSYGWRKTGKTPNPLIAGWNGRIKKANEEIARKGTTSERKTWLKMRIKKIKREIQDMEARSYLIAEYDPFIVMPINMITYKGDLYAARVGDYAVVIYDGKVYPTIVGDAGPSFKTGEASLRIAKQLNARAGIYSRPVSDLTVTYLVFPKSADKAKAPDYAVWKKRCSELLDGIGGLGAGYELFTWKKTLPDIKTEEELKAEAKAKKEAKEQLEAKVKAEAAAKAKAKAEKEAKSKAASETTNPATPDAKDDVKDKSDEAPKNESPSQLKVDSENDGQLLGS